MSVPRLAICILALAGEAGCHGASASTAVAAPHLPSFAVADRAVRVVNENPNALDRHEFGPCKPHGGWRPELIAPVVSFAITDLLTPTQHLRYVSAFDHDASLSLKVRTELGPDEAAIAIDPTVLILYDRSRESDFCLNVIEKDEIVVVLDLFNVIDDEPHL
jgi:hypothetical protein